MSGELAGKRLELLHMLVPEAARIAMLVNPNIPNASSMITTARTAASAIGRQIEVFYAGTNRDIDMAFASLVQKHAEALLVGTSTLFSDHRVQITTLAQPLVSNRSRDELQKVPVRYSFL
jgi:putative tryptophan/tyrosine transport system substrate-binding protein